MGEAYFDQHMGQDALRVWMDFWELTGGMMLDILRRESTGGDPEKKIPPEVTVVTIPSVRSIMIDRNVDLSTDRSGELIARKVKLELIDPVHEADALLIGGVEYQVDSVGERNLGNFSVWVVEAHR